MSELKNYYAYIINNTLQLQAGAISKDHIKPVRVMQ